MSDVADRKFNPGEQSTRMKLLFQMEPLYESKRFALVFASLYLSILLFFGLTLHRVGDFGVETDFYWGFAPEAKDFLLGKITIDAYHGPLYSWVLGLLSKIVGDLFESGIVISAFSASLSLYFIFEIVRSVFSADIAFISIILTAVNKTFIQYSYSAGSDMFFVAISFAGLFLLFRKPVITTLELFLSAVLIGLAYLVRYNGLIFLVVIPLIILLRSIQVKGPANYVAALIWIVSFVALIAPWSIYLKLDRGNFFYNNNYQNIAYELFANGRISWDQFWFQSANQYTGYVDVILKAPFLFLSTVMKNAYIHLGDDISQLNNLCVGIPSVLGGIIFLLSHPDRKKIGLFLMFLSFFAVLLTVFYSNRFSLFLIPMYAVLFAIVFKVVLSRFGTKRFVTLLINSMVAAVICFSYADSYSFNSRNIQSGPNEMILIRDWFHKEYGDLYDNAKIAARKPHIAYILNMKLYLFPMVNSYDSLITVLRKDSVKFLYYGPFEANDGPQDADLLDSNKVHNGLKYLCGMRRPVGMLYEVIR